MSNETPAPANVSVSFIDNPHASDVYADEAVGFFHANGDNIRVRSIQLHFVNQ
jgi:hypothetical protein